MIDEFIYGIGLFALLCAAIWVISQSPILRWLSSFLFVVFWGIVAIGGPLFAALAIQMPKGNYGAAVATVLFACPMSLLWLACGWPYLREELRSLKDHLKVWDGGR